MSNKSTAQWLVEWIPPKPVWAAIVRMLGMTPVALPGLVLDRAWYRGYSLADDPPEIVRALALTMHKAWE